MRGSAPPKIRHKVWKKQIKVCLKKTHAYKMEDDDLAIDEADKADDDADDIAEDK